MEMSFLWQTERFRIPLPVVELVSEMQVHPGRHERQHQNFRYITRVQ